VFLNEEGEADAIADRAIIVQPRNAASGGARGKKKGRRKR
jgi:hypothetical protein